MIGNGAFEFRNTIDIVCTSFSFFKLMRESLITKLNIHIQNADNY